MTAFTARSGSGNDYAATDAFGAYLQRLSTGVLLSAEEEVNLARRIEVGLFADARLSRYPQDRLAERDLAWLVQDGHRARDRFIECNLRLVVSLAKPYAGHGTPIMDIIQDGNIGLVRAVEKYDFTSGYKFSTYATWWIRQAIHRGIDNKARIIRIPAHTAEKLSRIKRAQQELRVSLDRIPAPAELAIATNLHTDEITKLLRYDLEPLSLQTPVGDGSGVISELIVDDDLPQPDECAVQSMQTHDIIRALAALPARERSIVEARFGLDGEEPRTLDQLATTHGVTRERVRQLEKRALAMLRTPQLENYLTS
ncbi:sigma-70 family RNA polymerase sigma factor [Cryobacterium sp. CG_9.6]|uniref:sigma-70 family RNA polymerase sigma factor n=1 Tax=Cryobacterium sp. CG_9.6 TaxID=2760710 RepID=UPI00247550A4|nr:sigma-70 family RNA polymerase sigma factor [Cryobacterium sp. CG_9.6]MDH6235513.1 RNA polymerase primary sigma factor [Cryobacterium sp. CG_9.6]